MGGFGWRSAIAVRRLGWGGLRRAVRAGDFQPVRGQPRSQRLLSMKMLLGLLLSFAATPASAHVTSDSLISAPIWTYDPFLVIPLYLSGLAFLLGTRNVWRSAGPGRGV